MQVTKKALVVSSESEAEGSERPQGSEVEYESSFIDDAAEEDEEEDEGHTDNQAENDEDDDGDNDYDVNA